jgi:hypothetical protein
VNDFPFPIWPIIKGGKTVKYVLVTINRGIIDRVLFYNNDTEALKALDRYVKDMNPEHEDAGVYDPSGMVANAKNLLDENDRYDGSILEHLLEPDNKGKDLTDKRIELISTTDPYTALEPGVRGTVDHIDDIGTIHITWDNGATLGLVPGEDRFKILD